MFKIFLSVTFQVPLAVPYLVYCDEHKMFDLNL